MFAFKIQTNHITVKNKVLNSFEQLEHWKPLLNLFFDSKITWNSMRKTVNCLKHHVWSTSMHWSTGAHGIATHAKSSGKAVR